MSTRVALFPGKSFSGVIKRTGKRRRWCRRRYSPGTAFSRLHRRPRLPICRCLSGAVRAYTGLSASDSARCQDFLRFRTDRRGHRHYARNVGPYHPPQSCWCWSVCCCKQALGQKPAKSFAPPIMKKNEHREENKNVFCFHSCQNPPSVFQTHRENIRQCGAPSIGKTKNMTGSTAQGGPIQSALLNFSP